MAGALLFTPTYGLGGAIAPPTLTASWIALSPFSRATRAARVGAAFNVLVIVAGLILLTASWAPSGLFFFAIAWSLLAVIVVLFAIRS